MRDLPLRYPISAIFGPTLQGEGHFVGYPMVFVRLAGCSVTGCSIRKECDEAPWKAVETLDPGAVVDRVAALASAGMVNITGGEPTDHDLIPLVDQLHRRGYRVHMETSGTRPVVGMPIEWLTVSPKRPDYVHRTGHVLKVVVRPEWGWPEVRALDEGTSFFHRYLQPLTNAATGQPVNLEQVKAMLLERTVAEAGRWALSSQAHRYWGIR